MRRKRSQNVGIIVSFIGVALSMHSAYASGPLAAPPAAPLSSSFPGPLWEVLAPAGGGASISNAHLFLTVPGGSNHDPLRPSNQAVQVVQPIANENFDISIKIDSQVLATDADTSQGLIALADPKNFIMFGLLTDGTNISLAVNTVANGVKTTVSNQSSFNEYQNPICLRLKRTGTAYAAYYSTDGVVWTEAASFTSTQIPAMVGPFAGNYNGAPTKAVPVVMAINWFDVL